MSSDIQNFRVSLDLVCHHRSQFQSCIAVESRQLSPGFLQLLGVSALSRLQRTTRNRIGLGVELIRGFFPSFRS
jgi:hypothetical protein